MESLMLLRSIMCAEENHQPLATFEKVMFACDTYFGSLFSKEIKSNNEKRIFGLSYFDLRILVEYMNQVYDQAFLASMGCDALTMLYVIFMCRKNDYIEHNFLSTKSPPGVWNFFTQAYSIAKISSGNIPVFIMGPFVDPLHPRSIEINFAQFSELMIALGGKESQEEWVNTFGATPSNLAPVMRAHTARMTFWLDCAANRLNPRWVYPGATCLSGKMPLFGFEIEPPKPAANGRTQINPDGVCVPIKLMPNVDPRQVYAGV